MHWRGRSAGRLIRGAIILRPFSHSTRDNTANERFSIRQTISSPPTLHAQEKFARSPRNKEEKSMRLDWTSPSTAHYLLPSPPLDPRYNDLAILATKRLYSVTKTMSSSVYERGLSFFPLNRAMSEVLATFTILKRTPGISPTACPERPNPATSTSSFSCKHESSTMKHKRRVGKSADNPALFRRGRSRIRASDRCSCVCKRKFSGICIYDDRSNGRCGSGRWNAKTSGV